MYNPQGHRDQKIGTGMSGEDLAIGCFWCKLVSKSVITFKTLWEALQVPSGKGEMGFPAHPWGSLHIIMIEYYDHDIKYQSLQVETAAHIVSRWTTILLWPWSQYLILGPDFRHRLRPPHSKLEHKDCVPALMHSDWWPRSIPSSLNSHLLNFHLCQGAVTTKVQNIQQRE